MSTSSLFMPLFDDFIAWLRSNPSRIFPAMPEGSKSIGQYCPVGVYARTFNKGEQVSVSHDFLLSVCGDTTKEYIRIDGRYHSAITAFDTATGFMREEFTAQACLDVLKKQELIHD